MEFWKVAHPADAPAAIDTRTGKVWCYRDLLREVARVETVLPQLGRKSLGLLFTQNRYECLVTYLAALRSGSALILLDSSLSADLLSDFLETYQPDWIFSLAGPAPFCGYQVSSSGVSGLFVRQQIKDLRIHPDLALLLTTSGSTGSPKLVRLTLGNLAANAGSISKYLGLTPDEKAITSLPISYSYGLSVVNSHLAVGASLVLTDVGVLQREFWDALDGQRCTSFAGVPYTYQMLLQTGLLKTKGASLRALTQAGGRLEERFIGQMYQLALGRGWKFFVMYGQTEATARISYVPFEHLGDKIGSVGVAIPNGELSVDEATEELIYQGPNVMHGYAENRADLAKGDELHGVLRTGDLARLDEDGYFYITGRLKRFLKMFGKRFNLDDAEKVLARRCETVVACFGRDDLLLAAVEDGTNRSQIHTTICEAFALPRPAVRVVALPSLPRTPNGKLDYKKLAEAAEQRGEAVLG
jgi:acyl-CoA synthetase (AMP-forming)/AMP-acid ligase II